MLVQTEFDGLLVDDILLEESEQTQIYEKTLKNSENIIKSYIYMKKLLTAASPFVNKITKIETINSPEKLTIDIAEGTGKIHFKSMDPENNSSIFINGGEYILFPTESIEIPIDQSYTVEIQGSFSMIQTEYSL